MADLRVELYGHLVGHLVGGDWRTFDFRAERAAVEHFGLGSTILSESVPLVPVANRAQAGRRRNVFAELLPEGQVLTDLAARAGARDYDVLTLLAHYGRDVAGAVQIWDPDRPGEPRVPRRTPLTETEVGTLLRDTRPTPLGNAPVTGKTSLAGVQDKIVLALDDGTWFRVHDGYPSTHIVKPVTRDRPSMIFDEEYGARIARVLGLTRGRTWLQDFDGTAGLVIERYDRSPGAPTGRIHQEDMNQVLGARGNEKYQELGGKVSLRRVAQVFSRQGDRDSLNRLLRLTVLAVAVANLDLHAKNLSLLHLPDGTSTLAPAYDVVPLRHQATDGRMALAVNGRYRHAELTADDLVAEATSWGLRDPRPAVMGTLEEVADAVAHGEPDPRAHPGLREQIDGFTRRLLGGHPAG